VQVLFGREGCRAHDAVFSALMKIWHQFVLGPEGASTPAQLNPMQVLGV
jgi:hypothetical protein